MVFYDLEHVTVNCVPYDASHNYVCERVFFDAATGRKLRCLTQDGHESSVPFWKRTCLFASVKLLNDNVINITNALNEYAPFLGSDTGITCNDLLQILAMRGIIEWRDLFIIQRESMNAAAVRPYAILFVMSSDLDELCFSGTDVVKL